MEAQITSLNVERWSEFEDELRKLDDERTGGSRTLHEPLFRGLGNSDWGLETTLERSYPLSTVSRIQGF